MPGIVVNVNVSFPPEALSPTLDVNVLTVLAGTTKPLTGREVARMVRRGGQSRVQEVLNRLAEHGLVLQEPGGRALLHTLNREHVGAPAVEALAAMRSEFLRRLREYFESWKVPAAHASMFGSAARGDGDTSSDIDLFVVRPADVADDDEPWAGQIAELNDRVRSWTGNHASVIEFSEAELPRLVEQKPPVLTDLQTDGIDLAGTPLRRLMKVVPAGG